MSSNRERLISQHVRHDPCASSTEDTGTPSCPMDQPCTRIPSIQHTSGSDRHRIVVVGGGVAGLELISQLAGKIDRSTTELMLIDAQPTHVWKPFLHQVAVKGLRPHHEEISYYQHARCHGYQFRLGTLRTIDRDSRHIILSSPPDVQDTLSDERHIRYDTLILAMGSSSASRAVPGASEFCHFLDTTRLAERMRRQLIHVMDQMRALPPHAPAQPVQISIIGGGATGVSLAAELAKMGRDPHGYQSIDHSSGRLRHRLTVPMQSSPSVYQTPATQPALNITLIESADRLLPQATSELAQQANQLLTQLQVTILTRTDVHAVASQHLSTSRGQLPSQLHIWAGGVTAPYVTRQLDLTLGNGGRIVVDENLRSIDDPHLFALGDCAYGRHAVLLPLAEVASQQAYYLADHLLGLIKGDTVAPFRYVERATLLPLGQSDTIGTVFRQINVRGLLATNIYQRQHKRHQRILGLHLRQHQYPHQNTQVTIAS